METVLRCDGSHTYFRVSQSETHRSGLGVCERSWLIMGAAVTMHNSAASAYSGHFLMHSPPFFASVSPPSKDFLRSRQITLGERSSISRHMGG